MIGDPMRLDTLGERAHCAQVFLIDRLGAADGQRHTMHYDRKPLAHRIEKPQELAAWYQIIFGADIQPVDGMSLLEEGLIMRCAQPKTKSGKCHEDGAGSRRLRIMEIVTWRRLPWPLSWHPCTRTSTWIPS